MTDGRTGRHAYLIMCHMNFSQLSYLLELLDDKRNDIYLHIDKKAKGFSIDEIKTHVKKSRLMEVKPIKISWGGDSMIKAELRLLSEATKTQHDYYHLLSGLDLPIKTQDDIHTFFSENYGYDFVSLERNHPHNLTKSYMDRLDYYYIFQNHIQRNSENTLAKLQYKHINLQKKLHVCRTKKTNYPFQKGSQWFSITHRTACYVVNEFQKYKKHFRFTFCGDEIFLQTILINSPLIDNVKDDCLRFIDWNRGGPYTFRNEDYDLLMNSNKLFARKFDMNVDSVIIDRIKETLTK